MSPTNDPAATEEVRTVLPVEILNGLDAMIAAQPETASRGEAVRHILREWLQAKGFMRHPGSDEGTRPEDLNSTNDD